MKQIIKDPYFKVKIVGKTPNPGFASYIAMHTCYAEGNALEDSLALQAKSSDEKLSQLVIDKCLKQGHNGIIEGSYINFHVQGFPHSVVVQARTHRHLEFNVQSQRYTGQRVIQVAEGSLDPEEVFYVRPIGTYHNRQGEKVEYTQEMRDADLAFCVVSADHYRHNRSTGIPEEQARDQLVQGVRQNFTFSGSLRSIFHFINLRGAADAQPEIQTLCYHLKDHLYTWDPVITDWYFTKHKKRLSM